MSSNFVELVLTCGSWQEAQKIADHLLENRLVACVEFMEIRSKYWWDGKLDEAKEIKLIMETIADNFDKVEAALGKLHSYETFVLQMIPIAKLSKDASEWLENNVSRET
jgi:periplasmic divalent cation tolerance protein